jgi:hypothetical protein
LVPEEFARRGSGERNGTRGLAWRWGIPALACLALAALIASDFLTGASAFWREHQVLTSLLTGLVLRWSPVFVLERVLAARDRRRWPSVGLMVAEKLDTIEIEEVLAAHVLDYRIRLGADGTEAEAAAYLEVLPEALEDPLTWDGNEEVPPLADWLDTIEKRLEEILETWAPVLIAAPGLAALADAATDLLTTIVYVNGALRSGEPDAEVFGGKWGPEEDGTIRLLAAVRAHRFAYIRIQGLLAAYREEG